MPSAVRRTLPRLAAAALAALLVALSGAAQPEPEKKAKDDPKPKKKDAPKKAPPKALTEEDVAAARKLFQKEREEAVEAKFPADELAAADELAKKAEAALDAGDIATADRFNRDARWQVPYLPTGLPPHVVRVLGLSRMRHADRVNAVGYSPEGTRLASASRDGTAKVWDLGNGRELAAYRGHLDHDDPTRGTTNVRGVTDVAFHPKGTAVASVSGSQVHLWDPATGKQLKVLVKAAKPDQPLGCLAFNADGKQLAVGGDDGIVRVYDTESGKELQASPPRTARVERVAFAPNGKTVAAVDSTGHLGVYAWTGPNTPPYVSVTDAGTPALGVAFTPDGAAVAVCGQDGKARLVSVPSPDGTGGNPVRMREFAGHEGWVQAVAVSPDGKSVVTAGKDKTVRVWDATTGKPQRVYQGHLKEVLAVAVRPDGKQIASGSDDGAIRLWALAANDEHRAITDAAGPLWAVAVSADGKKLAVAGADKAVRVYDPETGKLLVALTGHAAAVTAVAFFPDGNRLASAGGDRTIKVWDLSKKAVAKELTGHDFPVLALAVSGDGKLLLSGSADKTARGWDPDSGKQLWSWPTKTAVCAVAIRKDGKTAAAGTADGALTILDVSGGSPKPLFAQPAHVAGVAAVAYSADGSRLASAGGDGAVRVWDVADTGGLAPLVRFDGQPRPGTSSGYAALAAVGFSPDGRLVAAGGQDSIVRIWDIPAKSEVRGLRGHTDWVTAVTFTPDGRALVTAGADKAARVFDLPPRETAGGSGHLLAVTAVAVSPDGTRAATTGLDQTIKLWDLATGKELATLVGNAEEPLSLAFLGNGSVVLGVRKSTRDTGLLQFWSVGTGRKASEEAVGEPYTLTGSADGTRLAAATLRTRDGATNKVSEYRLYDADGKLLSSVAEQDREVKAVAFSADLSWAVSGDAGGHVRIWDVAKKDKLGADWPLPTFPVVDLGLTPDKKLLVVAGGKEGLVLVADVAKRATLKELAGKPGPVTGLVVSPTGDTFVTLGADRVVRAWSLKDPREPAEVRSWPLPVAVRAAAYTPDGKRLVTGNADGTAYMLELP